MSAPSGIASHQTLNGKLGKVQISAASYQPSDLSGTEETDPKLPGRPTSLTQTIPANLRLSSPYFMSSNA